MKKQASTLTHYPPLFPLPAPSARKLGPRPLWTHLLRHREVPDVAAARVGVRTVVAWGAGSAVRVVPFENFFL